jgi:hypothetical protein
VTVDRRIWLPALAALLGLGVALAVLLPSSDSAGHAPASEARPTPNESPPAEPRPRTIPQADWRVSVSRAGTKERLSRRAVTRLRAQRPRLVNVVRSLSDAMFLGGDRPASYYFSGPARTAFRDSGAGAPEGAKNMRTLRRTARIAIQSTTAKRAAAAVTVIARGVVDKRDFKLRHDSQLWLERTKKGWKVIAFDIDQRPMRKERNHRTTDGDKGKGKTRNNKDERQ